MPSARASPRCFDDIAVILYPEQAIGKTRVARRHLPANLQPRFLQPDLNEWRGDREDLVHGVLKRLHPEGPHPGLSDEEDSTFRLHLVLLVAHIFLRRLDSRQGGCGA